MWWQYALWGAGGAAAYSGVVFAQNAERTKGLPWLTANGGPGGQVYLTVVVIRLATGALIAGGVAAAGLVCNPVAALGAGAAAPFLMGKFTAFAQRTLNPEPSSSHQSTDDTTPETSTIEDNADEDDSGKASGT
ncbi:MULTISPECIES: hypothetical protein [unclassified Nocardia]|uniref:hypothetical protein n=1 Tax=unclassified Nocardia TaxID=2637762 RepID=UPI00278C5ABA|nr:MULTISPECIES: hypothetical protein [unclassified Nocardia]